MKTFLEFKQEVYESTLPKNSILDDDEDELLEIAKQVAIEHKDILRRLADA